MALVTTKDWSDWTTESLKEYEERLYDDEVAGDHDAWSIRDQVLWELNRRNFGKETGS